MCFKWTAVIQANKSPWHWNSQNMCILNADSSLIKMGMEEENSGVLLTCFIHVYI